MIDISFSNAFARAYHKHIKTNINMEKIFDEKIQLFIENPFDIRLKTHKLSGKLTESWSFSLNYQIRVVFTFVEENKVILENIGKHDNVY